MRYCWLGLIIILLGACGQPLQLNTPSSPRTTRTAAPVAQSPAYGPTTIATAGSVASESTATVQGQAAAPTQGEPPGLASPTELVISAVAPTQTPAVVVIPQPSIPLSNEQRWRAQQLERQVFDQQRLYIANDFSPLLWYDPLTGQSIEIGTIRGEFPAQAQFVLRSNRRLALEVPYRINNDFGLTAISEAVRERMRAAGYTESVEAYIEQTEAVVPK